MATTSIQNERMLSLSLYYYTTCLYIVGASFSCLDGAKCNRSASIRSRVKMKVARASAQTESESMFRPAPTTLSLSLHHHIE